MLDLYDRVWPENISRRAAPAATQPEELGLEDRNYRYALAAAIGLAAAGVAPPILVTLFPAARDLIRPALAADILFGLLILAPAAVGFAVALLGLPQVAAQLQSGRAGDAEHAVLRVFADALLFACTLAWAAGAPAESMLALALPVAAGGLAAAWALLLWVIVRGPVALPLRRRCATALDVALLSAFLHLGGGLTAGLYPLYPLLAFYAGYRFGERALIETVLGSVVGFALVVLSTEAWRRQPELALGLTAGLVVLPGCLIGLLRAIGAARQAANAAEAGRASALAAVTDALRPPLAVILAGPAEPSTRILAERIQDVLDLMAIETGQFPIAIEAFDLRALITQDMTELAAVAAEKGIELRWRIDPRLPPCVRGPAQATGRILGSLTGHFVALCAAASIRVALDTIDRAADRVTVQLRIDIDGTAPQSQPDEGRAAWQQEALTIGVVTRLAALMGGEVSIEGGPGPPCRFVVTLPLAVEPRAPEADLDLRGQEVLIVSGDEVFAGEVIGLLDRWHADARCVGDVDTAGVDHAGLASGVRPVVIVDGRDSPLTALAFAENLRRREAGAPLILFAGESSRIERLTEVDEPGLDCLLPMPLTERLLANAFRGLPLATRRVEDQNLEPRPTSGGNAEASGARITPIAAHPKFALEIGTTFDPKAVEALRGLGGGDAFLRELIDSFRDDAELLLQRLNNALAAADAAGFAQGVAELRRCAGHLGGRRICEMLPAPADVTEAELRGAGALLLQRLPAEIDRLIAALQGCLVAKQAQRS